MDASNVLALLSENRLCFVEAVVQVITSPEVIHYEARESNATPVVQETQIKNQHRALESVPCDRRMRRCFHSLQHAHLQPFGKIRSCNHCISYLIRNLGLASD